MTLFQYRYMYKNVSFEIDQKLFKKIVLHLQIQNVKITWYIYNRLKKWWNRFQQLLSKLMIINFSIEKITESNENLKDF